MWRTMKKIILAASITGPFVVAHAQDKPLSVDEIKAVVTGKTLDFPEDARGVTGQIKIEAGGTGFGSFRNLKQQRGTGMSAPVKWHVTEKGEFCTHFQQAGYSENCTVVQKSQDGSYARIKDGKVMSTFAVR